MRAVPGHLRHSHRPLPTREIRTRSLGTEGAETPAGGPGRTPTVWMQEETDLLLTFNRRFRGDRRINIKVLEFLSGKTRKQINDKRVHLGLTNRTAPMVDDNDVEPPPIPTNPPDLTGESPLTDDSVPLTTTMDIPGQAPPEDDGLDGELRTTLTSRGRNVGCFQAIHERLARLATEGSGQEFDDILADFVAALLGDQAEHAPGPNTRSRRRRHCHNHSNRSRFNYARCQDMYRKCPRKLVDMAIAGSNTSPPG